MEKDICEEIKRELEELYDIPFSARQSGGPEHELIIGPEDRNEQFFTISVAVKNHIRLVMEYQPARYSADFVRSMGRQPMEKREQAADFSKLLEQDDCEVRFRVNGIRVPADQPENWPEEWSGINLKVTRIPAPDRADEGFIRRVKEYVSLLTGMILSLSDIEPVEEAEDEHDLTHDVPPTDYLIFTGEGQSEGQKKNIQSVRYERNRYNRAICLGHYGYRCQICGFDFESVYGEAGKGCIEVHHIIPVSNMGGERRLNPLTDLIPVCPNCHAMLHRKNPPYTPDEVREMLRNNKERANG